MEPGTYVRPHRHTNPDKREAFLVLRGKILVVTFTDEGRIRDRCLLDPAKGNFGVEVAPEEWHMLISLEEGSVIYEIKDGPYNAIDDKNFASWAPAEGDSDCAEFVAEIRKRLGL